jgi:aminoglycoside phosphotransferase (APT) family kinase protein
MSQRLHRRNLLVTAAGDPVVTGVIDFEPASLDDPMADLAQTLLNATFHQPLACSISATARPSAHDRPQLGTAGWTGNRRHASSKPQT